MSLPETDRAAELHQARMGLIKALSELGTRMPLVVDAVLAAETVDELAELGTVLHALTLTKLGAALQLSPMDPKLAAAAASTAAGMPDAPGRTERLAAGHGSPADGGTGQGYLMDRWAQKDAAQ